MNAIPERENLLRTRIVEVARTWLNTPFVDGQGLKGFGVDCAYFLVRVAEEAGIVARIELPAYSPQVYLHRKPDGSWDDTYEKIILQYTHEISVSQLLPGDMVLYKVANSFTHGAIIESWPDRILHPIRPHGVIYSSANEGFVQGRPHRFFSAFGGKAA